MSTATATRNPSERGNPTLRLCVVCGGPVPERQHGRPGKAPACCSDSCKAKRHAAWYESNRTRIINRRRSEWSANALAVNAERRKNRTKNRDAIAAKRRKQWADDAVQMRARQRAYYAANKESIREQPSRARGVADKAGARERYLRWRAANPDGVRVNTAKWIAANVDHYRASRRARCQIRRARKSGAFVERVDPRVVYANSEGVCGICSTAVLPLDKWHVDHIVPLSKGGAHSYDNVQLAHAKCNLVKHAKLIARAG